MKTTNDLEYIFRELKNSNSAICMSISDEIMQSENHVLSMMNSFPNLAYHIYPFISDELKKDPTILDIVLPNIAKTIKINLLPKCIRVDKNWMFKFIQVNPLAHEYIDDSVKDNLEFNIKCVQHIPNFLLLKIPPVIWNNYFFIQVVISSFENDYNKIKQLLTNQVINGTIKDELKTIIDSSEDIFEFKKKIDSKLFADKLEDILIQKQYNKQKKI